MYHLWRLTSVMIGWLICSSAKAWNCIGYQSLVIWKMVVKLLALSWKFKALLNTLDIILSALHLTLGLFNLCLLNHLLIETINVLLKLLFLNITLITDICTDAIKFGSHVTNFEFKIADVLLDCFVIFNCIVCWFTCVVWLFMVPISLRLIYSFSTTFKISNFANIVWYFNILVSCFTILILIEHVMTRR